MRELHRLARTLFPVALAAAFVAAPAVAQDAAPAAPEAAPADATKVALELKLAKGDVFRLQSDMVFKMEMGGAPFLEMEKMVVRQFEVSEVADDGFHLDVTTEHVKGYIDLPAMGGRTDFDSKGEADPANPMAGGIHAANAVVTKGKMQLVVSKTGEVTEFKGLESLIQKHLADDPMAMMTVQQWQMNDGTKKKEFEAAFARLPAEPKATGETWKTNEDMDIGGGMKLPLEQTFTLTAATDDKATITVKGEVDGAAMGMTMTADVESVVSLANGIPLSATQTQKSSSPQNATDVKMTWKRLADKAPAEEPAAEDGDAPATGGETPPEGE